MDYKEFIQSTFDSYKCKSKTDEYRTIPIYDEDILVGFLKPVTYLYKIIRPIYVNLICQWREQNPIGFANRFKGTHEKTTSWIDNVLLPRGDRILFMVHTLDNLPVGHLGFSSFNFDTKSCEIDNVVKGIKHSKYGIMSLAMTTLMQWGKERLQLKNIYLKVLSENEHAIAFYQRLGFVNQYEIPLYKVERKDITEWVEDDSATKSPDKYYIYMKLCQ